MPKYQLLQNAYMKPHPKADMCVLCFEGQIVEYDGVPGPHMDPQDTAAHEALAAYYQDNPGATLDPTRKLSLTTEGYTPLDELVRDRLAQIEMQSARSPLLQASAEVAEMRATMQAMQAELAALRAASPAPKRS